MDERVKGALQIIFAAFVVIAAFYFSANIEQFSEFGYAGVFVISLLSAATIFIPAPGWAVVVAMGRVLDPYWVGIIAGIGGGIGEITGYELGRGAVGMVQQKAGKDWHKYKKWISKYDMLAIAFLAVIPNPLFDVAGLVAGSLRIPLWRFLLACIIGRTIRYIALAYFGAFTLSYV